MRGGNSGQKSGLLYIVVFFRNKPYYFLLVFHPQQPKQNQMSKMANTIAKARSPLIRSGDPKLLYEGY